jgi:hypothetical protein
MRYMNAYSVISLLITIGFIVAVFAADTPSLTPPRGSDLPVYFRQMLKSFEGNTDSSTVAARVEMERAQKRYNEERGEVLHKLTEKASTAKALKVGGSLLSALSLFATLGISLVGASKGTYLTGTVTEDQLKTLGSSQANARKQVLILCALIAFLTASGERAAAYATNVTADAKELAAILQRSDSVARQALKARDLEDARNQLQTDAALMP